MSNSVANSLRPIVLALINSKTVKSSYDDFTNSESESAHSRFCLLVDNKVSAFLHSLPVPQSSEPDTYDLVFPDNRGRVFHRIRINAGSREYMVPNAEREYSAWFDASAVPYEGPANDFFEIMTVFQGQSSGIIPQTTSVPTSGSVQSRGATVSGSTVTFSAGAATVFNPIHFTNNDNFYLFVDGYTGYNSNWDSIAQMEFWSLSEITISSSSEFETGVVYGAEYYYDYTGTPPIVTLEGNRIGYVSFIQSTPSTVAYKYGILSGDQSLTISLYPTSTEAPTTIPTTSESTTIHIQWIDEVAYRESLVGF
jgi:hypothetical protein